MTDQPTPTCPSGRHILYTPGPGAAIIACRCRVDTPILVTAVQARLALDLHQALGLPVHDGVEHQGHPTAETWWQELLATARALAHRAPPAAGQRLTPGRTAAITDAHIPPPRHSLNPTNPSRKDRACLSTGTRATSLSS